jgi:hypothetical protein
MATRCIAECQLSQLRSLFKGNVIQTFFRLMIVWIHAAELTIGSQSRGGKQNRLNASRA